MKCKNCGAEIPVDSKFCPQCGVTITEPEDADSVSVTESEQIEDIEFEDESVPGITEERQKTQEEPKKKSIPKPILIVGIIAAIAIVAVIAVLSGQPKTVNLNKYIVFETTGYDGYGTVRAYLDTDSLQADYGGKLKLSDNAKNYFGDVLDDDDCVELIDEAVSVSLSESSKLSNGQEITYTININEVEAAFVSNELSAKDGTYKVSGLQAVTTTDVFNDLTVTFNGVNGHGTVNLEYSGEGLDMDSFIESAFNELSNGDIVTITVDDDSIPRMAAATGCVPSETSKEYTVANLGSFVTDTSEIPDEAFNEMLSKCEKVIDNWFEENSDEHTLYSYTYLGNYLRVSDEYESYFANNRIYFVYEIQDSATSPYFDSWSDQTYYLFVSTEDAIVYPDGTVTYDDMMMCSNIFWGSNLIYNKGYKTLDALDEDVYMFTSGQTITDNMPKN